MRVRTITLKLLVMACTATCLGATFTWDGGGADEDWDTCDNWSGIGLTCCYPCSTSDSAIIPYDAQQVPWTIELTDETIDDLSVNASVAFYPDGASNTLTLSGTLTLTATQAPTLITMNSGAKIVSQ